MRGGNERQCRTAYLLGFFRGFEINLSFAERVYRAEPFLGQLHASRSQAYLLANLLWVLVMILLIGLSGDRHVI